MKSRKGCLLFIKYRTTCSLLEIGNNSSTDKELLDLALLPILLRNVRAFGYDLLSADLEDNPCSALT